MAARKKATRKKAVRKVARKKATRKVVRKAVRRKAVRKAVRRKAVRKAVRRKVARKAVRRKVCTSASATGRESHVNPAASLIQVDLDGGEIGRNRGIDVGIIGDTGIVMDQLTALARAEGFSATMVKPWLDGMRQRETERRERMRAETTSEAVPINPLRACQDIADVLDVLPGIVEKLRAISPLYKKSQ